MLVDIQDSSVCWQQTMPTSQSSENNIAASMSWLSIIVDCFHSNPYGSNFGWGHHIYKCARSNHLGAFATQWSCWCLSSVSIHIAVVLSATWFTLPTWWKHIAHIFWSYSTVYYGKDCLPSSWHSFAFCFDHFNHQVVVHAITAVPFVFICISKMCVYIYMYMFIYTWLSVFLLA